MESVFWIVATEVNLFINETYKRQGIAFLTICFIVIGLIKICIARRYSNNTKLNKRLGLKLGALLALLLITIYHHEIAQAVRVVNEGVVSWLNNTFYDPDFYSWKGIQ